VTSPVDALHPEVTPPEPTRAGRRWIAVAVVGVLLAVIVGAVLVGRGGGGTPEVSAANAAVGATRAPAAAAYVELTNTGSGDDRLLRVSTPVAPDSTLHVVTEQDGLSTMERTDGIDLPAGATVGLDPGGSHVMLAGLDGPLVAGSTVTLHLEFEHSAPIDVQAQVLPLEQLAERVGR
jgi:periplasmic copper chaperone A